MALKIVEDDELKVHKGDTANNVKKLSAISQGTHTENAQEENIYMGDFNPFHQEDNDERTEDDEREEDTKFHIKGLDQVPSEDITEAEMGINEAKDVQAAIAEWNRWVKQYNGSADTDKQIGVDDEYKIQKDITEHFKPKDEQVEADTNVGSDERIKDVGRMNYNNASSSDYDEMEGILKNVYPRSIKYTPGI